MSGEWRVECPVCKTWQSSAKGWWLVSVVGLYAGVPHRRVEVIKTGHIVSRVPELGEIVTPACGQECAMRLVSAGMAEVEQPWRTEA